MVWKPIRAGSLRNPSHLRGSKTFGPKKKFNLFLRVFNLFDTMFYNGFVFDSTGSPYYSRFPETDKVILADPTRFYSPRRIELGFQIKLGGT